MGFCRGLSVYPSAKPGPGESRSDASQARLYFYFAVPQLLCRTSHTRPAMTSLDIARTLIGFDTVSRNSNLGMIEWIRDRLAGQGVRSHLSYDDHGSKANLLATIGDRPGPGIALSGHTDVVPVDGQQWSSEPFKPEERDGRLYGRGAVDMKSFIACCLSAVPKMLAAPLTRPVHLAFTYDEEVGCLGAPRLIADARSRGVELAGCIIGEPTGMQVMTGHKGMRVYRCNVLGREMHSSLAPEGVNSIEYAARMIEFVRTLAAELRLNGPHDPCYSVPYPTLQTGLIRGGIANNIVPRDCEFEFDFRYLPDMDVEAAVDRIRRFARETLEPEMRRIAPEAAISLSLDHEAPGLLTREDDRLTYLGTKLTGNKRIGRVPFATDGGHFHLAGVPTIVVGPGSISQAHKPDEYIELTQIAECDAFVQRLITHLTTN